MAPVNPLDGDTYDKFATKITYAKLYPLIMADFMGKKDCQAVHSLGNMLVNTTGGPTAQTGQVAHLVSQGGSDKFSQVLKVKYKAALEVGDVLSSVTE